MTGPADRPTTAYTVHASVTEAGAAVIEAGTQRIAFDASWGRPQPVALPGPADLLASALAACLLKNVERCSALLPFRYERADVVVTAHRQDRPPSFTRLWYELSLVTDESPRRIELLHENLRRYGTVYNTLAVVCELDGTVVAATEPSGH